MSPPPSGGPAFRRCRCSTETDPPLARRIHSQVCSMDASRRCYAAEAGKVALLQGFPLVGETGFEPATARPPAGCATRLRHSPLFEFSERATGIEPALRAWKARVQPQHFARLARLSMLAARAPLFSRD